MINILCQAGGGPGKFTEGGRMPFFNKRSNAAIPHGIAALSQIHAWRLAANFLCFLCCLLRLP